jgi:hypothetical protein
MTRTTVRSKIAWERKRQQQPRRGTHPKASHSPVRLMATLPIPAWLTDSVCTTVQSATGTTGTRHRSGHARPEVWTPVTMEVQ